MKSICVFAGSNDGVAPEYREQAARLGEHIARRGLRLIYGGSSFGLMGTAANAALASGGEVTGIMPTALFRREIVHEGLTEFIGVKDMHERKATMHRMADGFIALPGGIGTFEELFEVLCWAQIGLHSKPVGLLNVNGYYNPLMELIRHSVQEGFAGRTHLNLIMLEEDAEELVKKMSSHDALSLQRTGDAENV
ncbi:TIGR00730 family Rossman fold protein [Paenibacillus sp. P96]|uniref:Cytokinin riboside 5'-monophosphate phosphoribohydrolase n=1 Tax=Paenibacillus zeirhizosphaerae TaxID=2987519 RepID=A0ABT9FN56_9BACL|nr:TIGR00730 family Rossman fold protein [Paenibacillus sp. P96]MDP4096164.1 TIGR00730 family Rossman fold protein [Paenibacillus sp. P96]